RRCRGGTIADAPRAIRRPALEPLWSRLSARAVGAALQGRQQCRAVGRAESGAGVPTGTGVIRAVAAAGDVVKARCAVEPRLGESDRGPERLVEQSDEAGPQWSYGACAADHLVGAVDADRVPGLGVGVAGDIRDAATCASGVDVVRHA